MNAKRRAELSRAQSLLTSAATIVERAKDDEQDCYDNLPENFQDGDAGQKMDEAIDHLSDALSAIQEASDCIEAASV